MSENNTAQTVRVRFAPSPTGPLHIGGVRTALYNYLFARQHGGSMLLRIEDTDQTRFVPGAEEYIIEALDWLGIRFDEGVGIGGEYGPYRQSDRKALYRPYALQLVESGWAYYAFDTAEELDGHREAAEAEKKNFQYDARTRMQLRNSLTLSEEETAELLASGAPYVIRFKFPPHTDIQVHDLIRGDVKVSSDTLDDKVLFKSDGMPTYHLANIVDDHLMRITHVIRGEEWLPSAPLHVMLYRAFGWEETMPQFAHLPLLLKPDGNGKLSKRDGDRLGFPVFPLQWTDPKSGEVSSGYRESGYFPEAVVNMLALLGWNPGGDEEIMSMDTLIEKFSIQRISKSGAKFDLEKAKWFNHQYLMMADDAEIARRFMPVLAQHGVSASEDFVVAVCRLMKERVNFVKELWDQTSYFFVAPDSYAEAAMKKRWKEDTTALVRDSIAPLEAIQDFTGEAIHDTMQQFCEAHGIGFGPIMIPLRIAIVGDTKGPDLQTLMALLGKEESLRRIRACVERNKDL